MGGLPRGTEEEHKNVRLRHAAYPRHGRVAAAGACSCRSAGLVRSYPVCRVVDYIMLYFTRLYISVCRFRVFLFLSRRVLAVLTSLSDGLLLTAWRGWPSASAGRRAGASSAHVCITSHNIHITMRLVGRRAGAMSACPPIATSDRRSAAPPLRRSAAPPLRRSATPPDRRSVRACVRAFVRPCVRACVRRGALLGARRSPLRTSSGRSGPWTWPSAPGIPPCA